METNNLAVFFKSIIDQDHASVVICNTEHEIIYMNPASIVNYEKYGGEKLLGQSLLKCHNAQSVEMIQKIVEWFGKSTKNNKVHTFFNEKQQKDGYMIALRDEKEHLIGYYEKHEFRIKDETPFYEMK